MFSLFRRQQCEPVSFRILGLFSPPWLLNNILSGAAIRSFLDLYLLLCALWTANIFFAFSRCSIKVRSVWFISAIWGGCSAQSSNFLFLILNSVYVLAWDDWASFKSGLIFFKAGNHCHTQGPPLVTFIDNTLLRDSTAESDNLDSQTSYVIWKMIIFAHIFVSVPYCSSYCNRKRTVI